MRWILLISLGLMGCTLRPMNQQCCMEDSVEVKEEMPIEIQEIADYHVDTDLDMLDDRIQRQIASKKIIESRQKQMDEQLQRLSQKVVHNEQKLDGAKQEIAAFEKKLTARAHELKVALESSVEAPPTYMYTVSEEDTLQDIASHFNVSENALKEANQLLSDRLYTGQRLVIPQ